MPPRARPRRGAWRGSRQARAGAAACFAFVVITLAAPGPAAAYRCEDEPRAAAPGVVMNVEDCRVPNDEPARPARAKKRGSMSSLSVLVLALGAVLLIPIGALGMPTSVDPFGRDRPY
jgi:hypothetical protein